MIRLTKEQADKIGYLKINEWYAIQPIELKDGTFILPEVVVQDIERLNPAIKIKDILNKNVSLVSELKKMPIREVDKAELKDAEVIDYTKR